MKIFFKNENTYYETKFTISPIRASKQKLILFGSSWGSALGVTMANVNPGLFYAYIGHSQLIHPAASTLSAYETVYELAVKADDQGSLDALRNIGNLLMMRQEVPAS